MMTRSPLLYLLSLLQLQLLLLCLVSLPPSTFSSSPLTASQHHRRGIQLAQEKNLQDAIQHLKEAVRLSPGDAEYHNNLGVVQLRNKEWEAATQSFQMAVQLKPGHASALKNLADLEKIRAKLATTSTSPSTSTSTSTSSDDEEEEEPVKPVKKTKKSKKSKNAKEKMNESSDGDHYPDPPHWRTRRTNTNIRDPLPRIPITELYAPKNTKYAEGRAPFIITGGMKDWDTKNVWSFEALTRRFPTSIVDFYPHNMDDAAAHPYLTELSQAMREFYTPTSAYPHNSVHPGTYIQWNVNLYDWRNLSIHMPGLPYQFRRDEEWLETCFSNDERADEFCKKTHWRMILIGTKGAGMFNHQDVLRTASWQAQVTGAKRWHICAPDQSPYLYDAGKVDVWDPDYEKYPLFHKARCYEDIVYAGEMIFYPKDYWHQTENLKTPSMSASGTIMDEDDYDEITVELKNECAYEKFKWRFSKELCADLQNCYNWWQQRFGVTQQQTCAIQS